MKMAPVEVIHAYRLLYRRLLQAVQYSKPARFTARDQLRRAFREERPSAGEAGLDTEGIKRTVWFLEAAARERGMEHRILRALLRTAYERDLAGRRSWKTVTSKLKTGSKQWVPPALPLL